MSSINYRSKEYRIGYNNGKRYQAKKDAEVTAPIVAKYKKLSDLQSKLLKMYEDLNNDLLKDFKEAINFKWVNAAGIFAFGIYFWVIITLTFI